MSPESAAHSQSWGPRPWTKTVRLTRRSRWARRSGQETARQAAPPLRSDCRSWAQGWPAGRRADRSTRRPGTRPPLCPPDPPARSLPGSRSGWAADPRSPSSPGGHRRSRGCARASRTAGARRRQRRGGGAWSGCETPLLLFPFQGAESTLWRIMFFLTRDTIAQHFQFLIRRDTVIKYVLR